MSGKSLFDPEPDDRLVPGPTLKPKDAASLILARARRSGFEVLMGQRARGHVFMPDKWVFPGGRVERGDARAPAACELDAETETKLRLYTRRRRPRALALAAARELSEEAGLRLGHAAGPELDKLMFIARAITPPNRPRRFDARFFLARAEETLADERPCEGDRELLHTRWLSFDEALGLDLPNVTRFVLSEARSRLEGDRPGPAFVRWTRRGHRMERL